MMLISSRPIRQIEQPSWLTLPATRGLNRPPTKSQLQLLPFQELEWENFERLCYRLAKTRGDVEQWAVLYGSRGQKQDGIDIFARRPDAKQYSCWQSKRYKQLTPAALRAAVTEFEEGNWAAKSDEFIICTSASIQDTKLQSEIEIQTKRLLGKDLKFTVLGQTELSTELKNKSWLVRDFFGREWVRDFCGDIDGSHSVDTLDAAEIATLRAELLKLYASNFNGLDPGILTAMAGHSSGARLLSILDRFVEPDIEILDSGMVEVRQDQPAEQLSVAASDLPETTTYPQNRSPSSRELLRRRVSAWVAEGDLAVIAADAGFGKSTTLRVFALDILGDGSRFPAVAQRWPDSIPIVMPFAFWVRIVEKDENNISLPSAVEIWFRKFDVSHQLLTLILRSLEERRALLLIDGLDEWSNEIAARSTLALLDTYVKTKSAPAILTGRPGGLTRLGALDPLWRQARLAVLSETQQRALTANWFAHLHQPDEQKDGLTTDGNQHVTTQVTNFFADLGQAGTLLNLSGVPLLLSGLISLYVRQVALPRSRFQAYEELVQLLLEVHPGRRAQAALDRVPRFAILGDASLRKHSLAYFAYHKRQLGFDAGCPVSEARSIIVEYLQSLDGAGLSSQEAVAGAKELLGVDADTAGLVIEKAPEEIGFVHAVFEETLAGLHLAGWRLKEQKEFVRLHAGNPRWTASILAMLHILTRPSDVDVLLRSIVSSDFPAAADVVRQSLVAEAVFGDFKCSPRLAAELTPGFFRAVTTDSWFPHKQTLLRLIMEAATSNRARESLRNKPHEWFPDPMAFRARIYPALKHWPKDFAKELLWQGLFNENEDNKLAAATTIAALFAGDPEVGDRLHALCRTVVEAETLCAAMEALLQGWWDHDGLNTLIAAAHRSSHPHVRLVGIRGRIRTGLQDGNDLDHIMRMAASDRTLFGGNPMLVNALIAGWPNDPGIIEQCLAATEKHAPRTGIAVEIAKRYLLHYSQTNPDLDLKVAALIRDDEYFFSMGKAYARGSYGPEVRAALDYRLDRMDNHLHNDIAHLAVVSGSDQARQRLITLLAEDDQWAFWPVYGLLAGWGMEDTTAAGALLSAANWPAEKAQYFAHHLPEIILDHTSAAKQRHAG